MQPGLLGENELTTEVSRNQELLLVNIWNTGFRDFLHNHLVKQKRYNHTDWSSPVHPDLAAHQQGVDLGVTVILGTQYED